MWELKLAGTPTSQSSKASCFQKMVEESNNSGARAFMGETILVRKTLCFFRVMWFVGSPYVSAGAGLDLGRLSTKSAQD